MRRRIAQTVTIALLAALCTGCGNGDDDVAPPSPAPRSPTGTATVAVRSTDLGEILVDGQGRTLYLFEADRPNRSRCNDACAVAWPPLLTTDEPQAGRGVNERLLGTFRREDGSTGVTYNDHPLYYFQGDGGPGDTRGQGIGGFGAEWYVLDADGRKIEDSPQTPSPPESPDETPTPSPERS